jgi:spore coat protein U-like protein
MKKLLILSLVLASGAVSAVPFIKSQPYPAGNLPKATACDIVVDGAAAVTSPVLVDAVTGPRCSYDIATIAFGAHTVTATFTVQDPIWGKVSSGVSNTINFTRPAPLAAPVIDISIDP